MVIPVKPQLMIFVFLTKLFLVARLLNLITCPDKGIVRVVVCVRGLQETIYAGQVLLKLLSGKVLSQYFSIFSRYVIEGFGLSAENSNDLIFRFKTHYDREFVLWPLGWRQC